MKKISILLFAIMMAGSLSAQIDSFSEEDVISKSNKPSFSKKECLQPYQGNLSPSGRYVYDIIGEQLFCKSQAKIDSTQRKYVLVRENNHIVLSNLQQGEYYLVKNILITEEEKDSLQNVFNNLPFISDTLYYSEVNAWAVAQLLDKSQPLPKKAKQYIIPKDDILKVLYNQYRKWPTEENFEEEKNINVAIYVLTDKAGKEYYVPMEDSRYENAFELKIVKSAWPNPISFYPGMLASVSDFVVVKGFETIKRMFENQRIRLHKYDVCDNGTDVNICKKIAFKDGNIVAAITDTLSMNISYLTISGLHKRELSWCQKGDTLTFLEIRVPVNQWYDGRIEYGTMDYCRINDLDSVETKIAYEKQKADQEARKNDERKRQELIQKYGQKIGQSIAKGEACVGMTKEQCKEAIGTPDEITKNTSNLGVVEVWTYTLGYRMFEGLVPITVVTFLDNKVSSVNEYSSWPF